MKSLTLFLLYATLGASTPAWARINPLPFSRYTSAAAAALGDAYLPLGEDAGTGLFYNPATLGKIRKLQVTALNLSGYANMGYFSMLGSNLLNTYQFFDLNTYATSLLASGVAHSAMGAQFLPAFEIPFLSFGVLFVDEAGARALGSSIEVKSNFEITPAIGTGFRLANGILRMGYSFQWVNKMTVNGITSSPYAYDKPALKGSAFSHNAGVAVTLPVATLPSVNFVARNIFGATYNSFSIVPFGQGVTGVPTTEPMTFDVSLSISPKLGRGVSLNLVTQYRDLFGATGLTPWALFSGGLELAIRDFFFLRGGYGQGYPSAGLGLKRRGSEFSLTWYSEELGSTYLGQRDQRVMFQYQLRLPFTGRNR